MILKFYSEISRYSQNYTFLADLPVISYCETTTKLKDFRSPRAGSSQVPKVPTILKSDLESEFHVSSEVSFVFENSNTCGVPGSKYSVHMSIIFTSFQPPLFKLFLSKSVFSLPFQMRDDCARLALSQIRFSISSSRTLKNCQFCSTRKCFRN